MTSFVIEIGEDFIGGKIKALRGLDGDPNEVFKEAMDKSQAAILNRLRTTFLAEQDPAGNPWLPSAAGIRRRAKGGTGTLFDTGRLFRSIQLSRAPDLGERTISTDVPYGEKHQLGQDGMPVRAFLTFTPEHEQLAVSIFQQRVEELCNG